MKVKLQPASSSQLAAYNPTTSNPPLIQVMIIANQLKVSFYFKPLIVAPEVKVMVCCCYPTPSEERGHGDQEHGRPWSPRSRVTP